MKGPVEKDYQRLFGLYGGGIDTAYQEGTESVEGAYDLLFEQVMVLLARGSVFNASLPKDFTGTAQRYRIGDAATVTRLRDPDTRLFLLSDFKDYLGLARMARRAG